MMTTDSQSMANRLRNEGMHVVGFKAAQGSSEDARQTTVYAREAGSKWIVVDGYQFPATYHLTLKRAGYSLLHVDDGMHHGRYHADVVLDQNICANGERYTDRQPYTRLLLGTRYAMLRHEFTHSRGRNREIPDVARKILVTVGGADPQNLASGLLGALKHIDIDDLQIVVVAGSGNPDIDSLERAVSGLTSNVEIRTNVGNMQEIMNWADVAVSGAGSTCWELCHMGLPSLLVVLADNQQEIAAELAQRGVALSMGRVGAFTDRELGIALAGLMRKSDLRCRFSRAGQELVDGRGAQRVVSCLKAVL